MVVYCGGIGGVAWGIGMTLWWRRVVNCNGSVLGWYWGYCVGYRNGFVLEWFERTKDCSDLEFGDLGYQSRLRTQVQNWNCEISGAQSH